MARTVTFVDSTVNSASKREFRTTLFHDDSVWKVLPFDASSNGAKADDADDDVESSPVLRVQRVVNGQPSGKIERLFISSLYLDDESDMGVSLPKTGALNVVVKTKWDDVSLDSDAKALAAIIAEIASRTAGTMLIKCSRKPVAINGSTTVFHKTLRYGRQVNLLQMNWNF